MVRSNHRRKLFKSDTEEGNQKKKKKACHGCERMKEKEMRVDEREIWRSAGVNIVFLHLKDFN